MYLVGLPLLLAIQMVKILRFPCEDTRRMYNGDRTHEAHRHYLGEWERDARSSRRFRIEGYTKWFKDLISKAFSLMADASQGRTKKFSWYGREQLVEGPFEPIVEPVTGPLLAGSGSSASAPLRAVE